MIGSIIFVDRIDLYRKGKWESIGEIGAESLPKQGKNGAENN